MKKKTIELELVNDIDDIITFQKLTIQSLPKNMPKQVVDIQKDILKILEAMGSIPRIDVNLN